MKLLILLLLMADVTIGGIRWHTDYAQARAAGKWLWVHFGENPG
ncbi:MAG: hypothetical protein U0931_11305 [Vulcanimicrobiota bacterium]